MKDRRGKRFTGSGEFIASIDIGSLTARLLVVETVDPPEYFRSLLRKRSYIRLAESFQDQEGEEISQEAVERTLDVLEDFTRTGGEHGVEKILAVSTGVMRRAANRDHILDLVRERTGINAAIISGEEEAWLTYRGVSHAIDISEGSFVMFDLGGGTTEFIQGQGDGLEVKSIPLGAVILTRKFLESDPPADNEIEALSAHIDETLKNAFPRKTCGEALGGLIGSGGTVTTLAAMINRITVNEINPERLNGLILERNRIEDLFTRLRSLSVSERMRLPGLDTERAMVIPAGAVEVIRILSFFCSKEMIVSHSDILEGIIISYLQGGEDD